MLLSLLFIFFYTFNFRKCQLKTGTRKRKIEFTLNTMIANLSNYFLTNWRIRELTELNWEQWGQDANG